MTYFAKRIYWILLPQILCLIFLVAKTSGASTRDLPHIQLEQHHVNIDLERNRFTRFKYAKIDTDIGGSWEDVPSVPGNPNSDLCPMAFDVDLSSFEFPPVSLCIFREKWKKLNRIYSKGVYIRIFEDTYTPKMLYKETQGVTGYVRYNPNSKVTGYVMEGKFYGQIRLFDLFRLHHVIFYIEPASNLKLYPVGAGKAHDQAGEDADQEGGNKPDAGDDEDKPDAGDDGNKPDATDDDNKPDAGVDDKPDAGADDKPDAGADDNKPDAGADDKPDAGADDKPDAGADDKPGGSGAKKRKKREGEGTNAILFENVVRDYREIPPRAEAYDDSRSNEKADTSGDSDSGDKGNQGNENDESDQGDKNDNSDQDDKDGTGDNGDKDGTGDNGDKDGTGDNGDKDESGDNENDNNDDQNSNKDEEKRRKKRNSANTILFENFVRDYEKIRAAESYVDATRKKSKRRRKKRQTKDQKPYSHSNIKHVDKDVIHSFKFKTGLTDNNIFDARRDDTYICSLCIWLQPNFAQKFSLGGTVQHGAEEVVDLVRFLDWIFRALDINDDGLPENIGFVINELHINDDIRVTTTGPLRAHPGRKSGDDEESSTSYMFSTNANTITTKSALGLATKYLGPIAKTCCMTLAFVYHNIAPAISTTNHRGACTSRNIAVISGLLLSSKTTKFDLFRAMFHAVAHLFGAHHDDTTSARCIGVTRQRFLSPYVMHPVQQLNVGIRPGSFRMSPCTKDHVTQFLASNGVSCLHRTENDTFCGNGIVEDGEECDCGSLWQCHLQEECCGESDTVEGCTIISPFKTQCLRPRVW